MMTNLEQLKAETELVLTEIFEGVQNGIGAISDSMIFIDHSQQTELRNETRALLVSNIQLLSTALELFDMMGVPSN